MTIPEPYVLILLALGAMRLTRLVGWDTITDPIRSRLTGHHHGSHTKQGPRDGSRYDRPAWMLFLTCPWCLGFWVSVAVWLAWQAWPHWTLVVLTPFAINEIVGLAVKKLDD